MRYCKAATRLLYKVGLETGFPDKESFGLVSVGLLHGLQEVMLAWDRISLANVVYKRNRLSAERVAEIPRKKDSGPRSVMANSYERRVMTLVMRDGLEAMRMISST